VQMKLCFERLAIGSPGMKAWGARADEWTFIISQDLIVPRVPAADPERIFKRFVLSVRADTRRIALKQDIFDSFDDAKAAAQTVMDAR
jgi:hypothetical protein